MKENKKRILIFSATAVLLILLVTAGIFFLKNRSEQKQKEEKETEEQEGDYSEDLLTGMKLEFQDFELLDDYFSEADQIKIQQKIRNFLKQETCYQSVTRVTCKDATIDMIQNIEFYCVINDVSGTVLHCIYEKDSGGMEIRAEEIAEEVLDQERRENTETFIESTPESEELPSEWDYVEDLELPLHLTGKEALTEMIPEEFLAALDEEMLHFLITENEYRREVEIPSDSVQNSDQTVTFFADFKTPRIDKKGIEIVYDKEQGSYQFTFQERE